MNPDGKSVEVLNNLVANSNLNRVVFKRVEFKLSVSNRYIMQVEECND